MAGRRATQADDAWTPTEWTNGGGGGRWWSGDKEQTEYGGRTERQKQIEKQGCKDAKARRTSVKRSVSQLRIGTRDKAMVRNM